LSVDTRATRVSKWSAAARGNAISSPNVCVSRPAAAQPVNVTAAAAKQLAIQMCAARLASPFSAGDGVSAGAACAALRSLVLQRFEAIAPAFRRWNSEEASHGLALRHHERGTSNVA
jgi:hypothetical protein